MACYCHLCEQLLYNWVTSKLSRDTWLVYKSQWHIQSFSSPIRGLEKARFKIERRQQPRREPSYYSIWCVCIWTPFTQNISEQQQCVSSTKEDYCDSERGWWEGEGRRRAAPKWLFHLYARAWLRGVLLKDKDWPLRPLKTSRGSGTACYNSSITAAPLCATIPL